MLYLGAKSGVHTELSSLFPQYPVTGMFVGAFRPSLGDLLECFLPYLAGRWVPAAPPNFVLPFATSKSSPREIFGPPALAPG